MDGFNLLTTVDDFNSALAASDARPVVVFKHSNMCSLSHSAYQKLGTLDQDADPEVYQITVQESRDLSNHVEESLGIRHESPQIIILRNRKPVYHTSHRKVSAETVRDNA